VGWTEGVWWSGMGLESDPLSVPLKEGEFKEDKTLLRQSAQWRVREENAATGGGL